AQATFSSKLSQAIELVVDGVREWRDGRGGRRRRLLAARVPSRQDAVAERPPGQQADAVAHAGGHNLRIHSAVEQAALVLGRDEARRALLARDKLGLDDLPGGEVGRADIAHLALL